MRYNLFRSAQINATAAPGYSTLQAMNALEEVFTETMPSEMGFDYLGMSFQEQMAQEGYLPCCHLRALTAFRLPHPRRASMRVGRCHSVSFSAHPLPCSALSRRFRSRNGFQYLRPDRAYRPDRPGCQKRHPDRRIRQRANTKRAKILMDAALIRRTAEAAPDPDDLLRIYPRLFASGSR